jgi:6-phosphogluconolactonase (cycloisomerase 2 family)
VWAIPKDDRDEGFALIQGLHQPTALCFDVNHDFLYVCDKTDANTGMIYQYEVDWDSDDTFELASHVYAEIYKGPAPTGCSIDEYGNMFFSTADDRIHIVSYLDLWSGFTN